MSQYPDACPVCPPGVPDAALPLAQARLADGGTLAAYECAACGAAWETRFDRHGWPAERAVAPVAPAQAAENRAILRRAMQRGAA